MARVARQAPFPDSITVVVTGDFEGSITARSSSLPTYTAERLGGIGLATAMTLPGEGSECTIVASAALFVSGADLATLGGVRLLAHEGWHAAMHQRQEETNDIRLRLGLGDGTDAFFHAMAGVAMGEYRVERSLCNEGWWPLEAYIGTLGRVLAVLDDERRIALQPGDDFPDRAWKFITEDLHQLLTHLAYVAAQELASRGTRMPTRIFVAELLEGTDVLCEHRATAFEIAPIHRDRGEILPDSGDAERVAGPLEERQRQCVRSFRTRRLSRATTIRSVAGSSVRAWSSA